MIPFPFSYRRRRKPAQTLVGDGLFRIEVVGESFYQADLEQLCGGRTEEGVRHHCTAVLVPEPDNPKDRNAIRVDIGGRAIGYLSRGDAIGYRDGLGLARIPLEPISCGAVIRGGWDRRGDRGQFGVMLDMDWPPRFAEPLSRSWLARVFSPA